MLDPSVVSTEVLCQDSHQSRSQVLHFSNPTIDLTGKKGIAAQLPVRVDRLRPFSYMQSALIHATIVGFATVPNSGSSTPPIKISRTCSASSMRFGRQSSFSVPLQIQPETEDTPPEASQPARPGIQPITGVVAIPTTRKRIISNLRDRIIIERHLHGYGEPTAMLMSGLSFDIGNSRASRRTRTPKSSTATISCARPVHSPTIAAITRELRLPPACRRSAPQPRRERSLHAMVTSSLSFLLSWL